MTTTVVAGVVYRDGLILAARRKGGVHAGQWEFPGGKVHPGESPEAALRREFCEEFGVEIRAEGFLCSVPFAIQGEDHLLMAYEALHISGRYRPRVHSRIIWLKPEELSRLEWAPADLAVVRNLTKDWSAQT